MITETETVIGIMVAIVVVVIVSVSERGRVLEATTQGVTEDHVLGQENGQEIMIATGLFLMFCILSYCVCVFSDVYLPWQASRSELAVRGQDAAFTTTICLQAASLWD